MKDRKNILQKKKTSLSSFRNYSLNSWSVGVIVLLDWGYRIIGVCLFNDKGHQIKLSRPN